MAEADFSPLANAIISRPVSRFQHVCRCTTRVKEVGIFNMATLHTSYTPVHQCANRARPFQRFSAPFLFYQLVCSLLRSYRFLRICYPILSRESPNYSTVRSEEKNPSFQKTTIFTFLNFRREYPLNF